MPTRITYSLCLVLTFASHSLFGQGQFYLPPGSLVRFGLDSLEITSLAAEPPRGPNYPQGVIAGFPLWAGTKGHGVYAILPFATATPRWQARGLDGRTVTALNVQHQGAGPLDWLSVQAAVLAGTDSTTSEYVAAAPFLGGTFSADTSWRLVTNDSVKKNLRLVRTMASGSYSGHEPPLPILIGGAYGVARLAPDSLSGTGVAELDSVDVGALAWAANGLGPSVLAGGMLNGRPIIYRSQDEGSTWISTTIPKSNGGTILALSTSPGALSDTVYAGTEWYGLWRSTDGGGSWDTTNIHGGSVYVVAMDPLHSKNLAMYAGSPLSQVCWTNNGGKSWEILGNVPRPVRAMAVMYPNSADSLPYLFLGTRDSGLWVYRPKEPPKDPLKRMYYPLAKGNLWEYRETFTTTGIRRYGIIGDTALSDGYKYAILVGLETGSRQYLRQAGDTVFAYTARTDGGGIEERFVYFDFSNPSGGLLSMSSSGYVTQRILPAENRLGRQLRACVFRGQSSYFDVYSEETVVDSLGLWEHFQSVSVAQSYALQGAIIDGVHYGTVTSAGGASMSEALPTTFRLEQNFPNPFNPTTTLRYALPHASHVTLAVFDALGRRVAELVNGDMDAGVHEVNLDGAHLASGVYFCKLEAGSYTATRVMLLVR